MSQAFGTQYIHSNVSLRASSWKDWVVLSSDLCGLTDQLGVQEVKIVDGKRLPALKAACSCFASSGTLSCANQELFMQALHVWCATAQSTHQVLSLKKTNQRRIGLLTAGVNQKLCSRCLFPLFLSPPAVFPVALRWTMLMGMCSSTVLLLCFQLLYILFIFNPFLLSFTSIIHLSPRLEETAHSNKCKKFL